jgi:hypothetical protein
MLHDIRGDDRIPPAIRFASIAKAHWRGRMLDQFHQRDRSELAFPMACIAGVSVSGLISTQDIFITEFHELKIVYKCVFSRLSWRKRKRECRSCWLQTLPVFSKYLINVQADGRLNEEIYTKASFNIIGQTDNGMHSQFTTYGK